MSISHHARFTFRTILLHFQSILSGAEDQFSIQRIYATATNILNDHPYDIDKEQKSTYQN